MAWVLVLVCIVALPLTVYLASSVPQPRIALYGDSLSMQAAQDFQYLADEAGGTTLLAAYNGQAICDVLPRLASDASTWHPTVAVLEFTGDALTPCMAGYQVNTPAYDTKYLRDAQTAIATLRSHAVPVVLVGAPLDSNPGLSVNVAHLNALYAALARSVPGVTYADAGRSVLADGRFTWTLPCLPFEQCSGPSGTDVVRSPDGIHFCPDGRVAVEGPYDVCDVYSSGSFRFAASMLTAALER